MAGKESKGGLGDWASIVATISLLCGAIWANQAADAPRPIPPLKGDSVKLIQDVDARLWQDPFEAVIRHRESEHKKAECYRTIVGSNSPTYVKQDGGCAESREYEKFEFGQNELKGLIKKRLEQGNVTVLAVMLNGGAYVGAGEFRRQARYAVLAGLNVKGYVPEDAQHIEHLTIDKKENTGSENSQNEGFPKIVPFEWLTQDKKIGNNAEDGSVLLIWLNEEAFDGEYYEPNKPESPVARKPLVRLANFFRYLYPESVECPFHNKLSLKIIGPGDSTVLEHMAEEMRSSLTPCPRLEFYSPWASIHDDVSYKTLQQKGIPFHRIGPDDFELAKALKNELKLRNVTDTRHIALINQWDTAYARNLRKNLCEAWQEDSGDQCLKESGIIQYEFLRGLDGKLIGNKAKADNNKPGDDKESNTVTASSATQATETRAEGDVQIDYLRRIDKELQQKDYDLRKETGKGIRAIGLIANDYYDKLLILSILKPAFPEVVFFTTDLDDNMLNGSDDRYTRNLVVASSFDLTLNKSLQQDTPPFRSSLQTAAYAAVLTALQSTQPAGNIGTDWQPLLFEIGSNEAVRLTAVPSDMDITFPTESLDDTCEPSSLAQCDDPHPDNVPQHAPPRFSWIWSVGFLFLLVLSNPGALSFVLKLMGKQHRETFLDWIKHQPFNKMQALPENVLPLMFTVFVSLVIMLSIWGYLDSPEPFFWSEGVSAWPSEIIRLFAIALSLYYTHRINDTIRSSDREISHHFFDIENLVDVKCGNSWGLAIQKLYEDEAMFIRWEETGVRSKKESTQKADEQYSAEQAWREYLQEPLVPTAALYGILFFMACYFFIDSWGMPEPPVRGVSMAYVDKTITLITVFLLVFLVFYVNNATGRVARLAQKLWGKSIWKCTDIDRLGFSRSYKDNHSGYIGFDNWLDIQLIARCTEVIKPFVFYPVSVLFLVIFARSRLFDAWSVPWPLLVVYGASLLLVVSSALLMRWAAEATRDHGIEYLSSALMRAKTYKGANGGKNRQIPDQDTVISQLETVIEEAKSLNRGAFSSFAEQSYVQAILAFIATLSSVKLLDFFQFG
ncbi:hypothetical protein CWO84_10225 [Methylomonas sp. Kb3]|uniref:hypothetical protein n=1 Tax=Methylomonas sp. Kb3 TaxID=1611544 RepID=UPI000C33A333|nr:hypothetical protein [Methylomonas sp. Kb3]PKD40366.1 hypothetical protein CWO84_10225 [Methylomonas sp. Kb3]